ncbi:MAG TPA: hypothetical protein VK821_11865, partial [Dehalococcoidia bacterium]|nr:hypothetical protein [Dehalococcoidia bacterium]
GEKPTGSGTPSSPEWWFIRLFERGESFLIAVVSLFLVIFVVIALVAVLVDVHDPLLRQHDFTTATLEGVNGTFLAVILLELLHTTLSRGPISQQLEEFLVIGVTAGVRHGLELAAGSRQGNPRDVVISLAINSVGVLVLVLALWLIRGPLLRAERPEQLEEE